MSKTFKINIGSEISKENISKTFFNKEFYGMNNYIFGNCNYLNNNFNFSIGGRYGRKFDENNFSLGINLTYNFSENFQLFADASYIKNNLQFIYNNLNDKYFLMEEHMLEIFGGKYFTKNWKINFNIFYRNIENPIVIEFEKKNIYSFIPTFRRTNLKKIIGIDGLFNYKFPQNIELQILFNNSIDLIYDNSADIKQYSNLFFSSIFQYTYCKFLSSITFGMKFDLIFNSKKLYYNPIFQNYLISDLSNGLENDGLSLFMKAKLGNCNVRII